MTSGHLRLPKVLATSVIRSSHLGEGHGGAYLVDLASGTHEQVMSWDDDSIDWQGRGAERGLRGIAFYEDRVLIAASEEVLVYTPSFELLGTIKNRYASQIHEIFVDEGPTLRRYRAAAQGRAAPIRKRTSHITVVVHTKDV